MPPRNMGPDWGPDLSNTGEDALTAHAEVQAQLQRLRDVIRENAIHMRMDLYEELESSLEEAARKPAELEELIYQEEADRAEDARFDAAERRAEERWDEGVWP